MVTPLEVTATLPRVSSTRVGMTSSAGGALAWRLLRAAGRGSRTASGRALAGA